MSRVGNKPVDVPKGVDVKVEGSQVTVKGAMGELNRTFSDRIGFDVSESVITVTRPDDSRESRALHGLSRALLSNMVVGVSDGFRKELEIQGVGYRASLKGNDIELLVGFSHPVLVKAPNGITFEVPEPTRIVLRPSGPVGAGAEFEITLVDGAYRVTGTKVTRWVRQTDFANDEAVGYLADRLNRLGVEERLLELGAEPGDDIVIGDGADAVIFDFDPQIDAGAENLGRRGEDHRFYDRSRRTNVERREELVVHRLEGRLGHRPGAARPGRAGGQAVADLHVGLAAAAGRRPRPRPRVRLARRARP